MRSSQASWQQLRNCCLNGLSSTLVMDWLFPNFPGRSFAGPTMISLTSPGTNPWSTKNFLHIDWILVIRSTRLSDSVTLLIFFKKGLVHTRFSCRLCKLGQTQQFDRCCHYNSKPSWFCSTCVFDRGNQWSSIIQIFYHRYFLTKYLINVFFSTSG